jgi:hypothetical protein
MKHRAALTAAASAAIVCHGAEAGLRRLNRRLTSCCSSFKPQPDARLSEDEAVGKEKE